MYVRKPYFSLMNYLLILFSLSCFTPCRDSSPVLPSSSDSACLYNGVDTYNQKNGKLILHIDLNDVHQTIHSFGASDCWTAKFIGNWADTDKKNKIADLLFSLDTLDNGNPGGIGLSLWRFNIGAGSYEQGDSGGIATDWRREECFLRPDGSYDWNKQSGQQWFLQAAKQRKVKYTVGFAISPPVYMTKNGKAFSPRGTSLNIQPGKLVNFVDFLVTVADHFHFDYISPVNEPQWDWKAGNNGHASQEGSPALNSEISGLTKLLAQKLSETNSPAGVVIGEAGQWDFLYGRNTDGRGDQVTRFFSPSSPDYLGNLTNVKHVISAHSYFTTCPANTLVNIREQVSAKIKQADPSLETWMTEFGVLGNICDQYNGSPRHTNIDYGLYVAEVIYADLAIANVSSWQWWLAVNPYNYSDGLVYINDPSGAINVNNCKKDGIIVESKQLWSLGNYSRFIRPGMKRVGTSVAGSEDPLTAVSSLMVSAYKDDTNKELVLVFVNVSNERKILQFEENSSFRIKNNLLNAYVTNVNKDLERSFMHADSLAIGPRSIVTLTGSYQ